MKGVKRSTALLGSASAVALMVAAAPAAMAQTKVEISGYIKGDFIYDFDGGTVGDTAGLGSAPLDGSAAENLDGHTRLHARQSRIRFVTSTPTSMGDLKTYLEGDFFGGGANEIASNSSALRLRHAYGQLGNLLVGQTWSNFVRFNYASSVDFGGPEGQIFARQGQVRYTFDAGSNTKIAVSLENPEVTGISTLGGSNLAESAGGISNDELPDLVVMADYNAGGNTINLGGVLRQLNVDTGVAGAPSDSATGWGIHVGGTFNVLGKDALMGMFTYGEGVGRYFADGTPDAVFNNTPGTTGFGNLETVTAYGWVLSYDHAWNDTAHSAIMWGHVETDDNPFMAVTNESKDSIHLNYRWNPVSNVEFGVEWIYIARDTFTTGPGGGADGDHHRVQFGAKYNF